jgi:hypothetical protein
MWNVNGPDRGPANAGDNQYNCRHCAKKVDAQKGLAFGALPKILTITLKVSAPLLISLFLRMR